MLFTDNHDPDAVLNWFVMCHNAVAAQHLEALGHVKAGTALPRALAFLSSSTYAEVEEYFDSAKDELEIACVLKLVAAAEARLRHDARQRKSGGSDQLAKAIQLIYSKANDDDRFVSLHRSNAGILNAWQDFLNGLVHASKTSVDAAKNAIGGFVPAYEFRHWIAHGRYWKQRSHLQLHSLSPRKVANVVKSLFQALRDASALGGVAPF